MPAYDPKRNRPSRAGDDEAPPQVDALLEPQPEPTVDLRAAEPAAESVPEPGPEPVTRAPRRHPTDGATTRAAGPGTAAPRPQHPACRGRGRRRRGDGGRVHDLAAQPASSLTTPASMHRFDGETERLAAEVFDYLHWRLRLDPVPLDHTASRTEMEAVAPDLIREAPNDASDVLHRFTDVLAPRVLSSDSPRFLSFIPAAPTKASLLFDAVVSASSLNGTSWLEAPGAVHAENEVLRFLARTAGLPEGSGGCFLSGGSAANLSALVVARDVARHRRELPHGRRMHLLASDQVHSSVSNTARILDVDVVAVATRDGRLHGEDVAAAVDADDDRDGLFGVVATAGTTNAGIVDDLDGVGRAAAAAGAWFHVDGAYGAAALLAPSARGRFAGIERADSFVVDPHKWLFAPFDCAALLYREPQLARGVHTQDASYLDAIHDAPDEWNPTDFAYHLTRRARGLAIWFSLAVHGVAAYRAAIETVLELARWTAARIDAIDDLDLVREPDLGIVMFRRRGWGQDDYDRWSRQLLADGLGFVLPSKWQGEPILRFAFLHPDTSHEIVEEILATLVPGDLSA